MLDLESIELIKQLKARYFRSIDRRDVETLEKTVFLPDSMIHFVSTTYEIRYEGWPEMAKFFHGNFTPDTFGMHNGHTPEITVDGDRATGLWYLHDVFYNFKVMRVVEGTALYEDEYVRRNGEWRILNSRYNRLLEVVKSMPKDIRVTSKPMRG